MAKKDTNKKRNTPLVWVGAALAILGTVIRSGGTTDGMVSFGYALFVIGIVAIIVGFVTKRKIKEDK